MVLGVSHHDCDCFALQVQLARQSVRNDPESGGACNFGGRGILVGDDVGYARHLLGRAGVDVFDARVGMRAGEKFRVQQIGEPDAAGVLGFAGEARDGNLAERGHRLAEHVEIFGRITLPFTGDGFLRPF
jgi:hypothetical protein